jgi:hypothetical protein
MPAKNASDVDLSSDITVTFGYDMLQSSITSSSFIVSTSSGTIVPGTISYDIPSKTVSFVPDSRLKFDTSYTVHLTTDVLTSSDSPLPEEYSWSFSTVKALDVLFLIDTSADFSSSLTSLHASMGHILSIIRFVAPDSSFAVAEFSDFPISPYGSNVAFDVPYSLRQAISADTDTTQTQSTISNLAVRDGGDMLESQIEALYQSATGAGLVTASFSMGASPVNWRSNSVRVIVLYTTSGFHGGSSGSSYSFGGHTLAQASSALIDNGIVVLGIQSGTDSVAATDIQSIVNDTGGLFYQSTSLDVDTLAGIKSILGN